MDISRHPKETYIIKAADRYKIVVEFIDRQNGGKRHRANINAMPEWTKNRFGVSCKRDVTARLSVVVVNTMLKTGKKLKKYGKKLRGDSKKVYDLVLEAFAMNGLEGAGDMGKK